MYTATYTGWADIGEIDGVSFPKGVPVEVTRKMASRLRGIDGYEVVTAAASDGNSEGAVVVASVNEEEVKRGDGSV